MLVPTPKAVAFSVALLLSLSLLVITQLVIDSSDLLTGTAGTTFFQRLPGKMTNKRHKDGCLVVFHIAKTGGTSMKKVVKGVTNELGWTYHTWYGSDITVPRDNQTVASYSNRATHVGHILPHFLDLTNTHECKRMTILRDPIDRVISLFYYQEHSETMWTDCLFGKKDNDNDESCPLRHQYRNDMTRMFTGNGTVPGTWTAFGMQLQQLPGNNTNASINTDRSVLQDAKQFLLDIDLVCFLDDFDRCEADLRKMLELEAIKEAAPPAPALNIGNNTKIITKELLTKMLSVNKLDVELYDWAVLNFHHNG
jgi:hypothetical protein